MKIVFMGTPDFAVDSLDSIYKSNHDLCCVVTIPDKKAGRGQKMKESAVKKYCISNRIKILQPVAFNDKVFINNLKSFKADLFVVVAFKILPKIIWEIPCKGTINIHASLLPQLRGAAPINWAIINGLRKTGLTSFYINEDIDTGDIIMKKELEISENDNFGSLYTKLKKLSAGFIIDTIESIENGLKPVIQTKIKSELLKAPKIDKENTRIRWDIDGRKINNLIKGLSPYPGAWSTMKSNEIRVKILDSLFIPKQGLKGVNGSVLSIDKNCRVKVKDGYINIFKIKVEGKKEQSGLDFLNGIQRKKLQFF